MWRWTRLSWTVMLKVRQRLEKPLRSAFLERFSLVTQVKSAQAAMKLIVLCTLI
jgi:hypothetical protein